jgi:uncharacterized protein (DUF3820 family)
MTLPRRTNTPDPDDGKYMTSGKHEGELIEDLPDHYPQWLYDKCEVKGKFTQAMYEAVERELR